ncbi:Sporulation sigma-E factor-processing peptidase [Paenibacillus polymyxa E681]|uniref:sigma-E processing peptidase SpoIIGA n=1 Tax=Paenibacillus polymyxa TaxID=1406 RepID=UPI0001E31DD2|nr:sigma-E processing peptidase SpoIIGA [Paenibacillus polymyxa]ADM70941.1 peptidase [Paenibacillus polymyxa E681]QNV57969.1 Sporulation sigma-E factor-processing peptidase [Paenibacillus polymyxa E681]QNV62806.1 Sporulation sigma-E factor-processing peptidase [Paenibacillus polymyxa E681]
MVVYIDLIFLANLFIDAVLLMVTAWMRKIRPVWWRLMVSAGIGAMYVVMMFVPELSFLFTFLIKLALSVIMLLVAFGFGSMQKYLRTMGAFYMINFVAAGGILGMHYFLQNTGELFNGIWYTASGGMSFELKIAFWFILCAFGGVMLFFRIVQSSKQRTERMSGFLGQVQVWIGQDHIECTGLLDTGNQLYDPLTRTPVMVMEAALWESYLPASWLRKCSEGNADQMVMELGDESFSWQDRVRLVPYRGINRNHSFMLAIKPDRVEVVMNGVHFVHHRVLIGLDGGTLSAEGKYRAIIHPDVTAQEEGSVDTNQKRDAHFSEHFTESG